MAQQSGVITQCKMIVHPPKKHTHTHGWARSCLNTGSQVTLLCQMEPDRGLSPVLGNPVQCCAKDTVLMMDFRRCWFSFTANLRSRWHMLLHASGGIKNHYGTKDMKVHTRTARVSCLKTWTLDAKPTSEPCTPPAQHRRIWKRLWENGRLKVATIQVLNSEKITQQTWAWPVKNSFHPWASHSVY